ncbi:MAG TPA: hypothetical protein VK645_02325 [Chitinophagaceae bacterium]|nr:hypothetical protein [Chitinophagaceae bacterium]
MQNQDIANGYSSWRIPDNNGSLNKRSLVNTSMRNETNSFLSTCPVFIDDPNTMYKV